MKKLIKPSLVLLAGGAILLGALFASSRLSAAPAPPAASKPSASSEPSCEQGREDVLYGHIKSLTRQGDHFVLRFDPALFLGGVTANTAAAEDGAVEPGEPVPNDNYVVDESHRLYTYLVPESARVTVLTAGGALNGSGFPATPITVSELVQLVHGETPVKLFEPLDSGLWMHVHVDSVCSLEQQYRP